MINNIKLTITELPKIPLPWWEGLGEGERTRVIGKYNVDLSVFLTGWSLNLTVGNMPNHLTSLIKG